MSITYIIWIPVILLYTCTKTIKRILIVYCSYGKGQHQTSGYHSQRLHTQYNPNLMTHFYPSLYFKQPKINSCIPAYICVCLHARRENLDMSEQHWLGITPKHTQLYRGSHKIRSLIRSFTGFWQSLRGSCLLLSPCVHNTRSQYRNTAGLFQLGLL